MLFLLRHVAKLGLQRDVFRLELLQDALELVELLQMGIANLVRWNRSRGHGRRNRWSLDKGFWRLWRLYVGWLGLRSGRFKHNGRGWLYGRIRNVGRQSRSRRCFWLGCHRIIGDTPDSAHALKGVGNVHGTHGARSHNRWWTGVSFSRAGCWWRHLRLAGWFCRSTACAGRLESKQRIGKGSTGGHWQILFAHANNEVHRQGKLELVQTVVNGIAIDHVPDLAQAVGIDARFHKERNGLGTVDEPRSIRLCLGVGSKETFVALSLLWRQGIGVHSHQSPAGRR